MNVGAGLRSEDVGVGDDSSPRNLMEYYQDCLDQKTNGAILHTYRKGMQISATRIPCLPPLCRFPLRDQMLKFFNQLISASLLRVISTVLLRIHRRRSGRGYHVPCFPRQIDQEVMDLLQIWFVHCRDVW